MRTYNGDNPFDLNHALACMDWPDDGPTHNVFSADDLLPYLVAGADNAGRNRADRALVWRWLPHEQWDYITRSDVGRWLDELVERGDITVDPLARDCYGGSWLDIYTIQDRRRFARWAPRQPIPKALRRRAYERDGYRCVECGTDQKLSIDHIHPWSKGGEDTFENFQTLCRPCNSRKSNRITQGAAHA